MDTLYLVKPGFADPAFPGRTFYCWHCALIEGVLGSFPDLAGGLVVNRIDWPRPRNELIEAAGVQNQSVPLLLLNIGDSSQYQSGSFNGRAFISDKDAILAALAERHGFPDPHP